jgi:LPS-assembly lipoprotein
MSSSSVQSTRFGIRACIALAAALGVMSGCTVQPLYSTPTATAAYAPGPGQLLSTVAVEPVSTRVSQEVRNQLIFLMSGGAGEPADPRFTVKLNIIERDSAATTVPVGTNEDSPTSAIYSIDVAYNIMDASSGLAISAGRRTISSAYDVPRQEFAALRARRDAQNRAAREIAELLRLAIAQDLSRI